VVEVVENQRVVFTWGWERGPAVPPGSTTVAIELVPRWPRDVDTSDSLGSAAR
jgi:uncharacterized protein YndB with AHSA1/START domain